MKKRGSSANDLWKFLNKFVSVLCFPTNAFLYDISYPHFTIMVAWIVAIDKVKLCLLDMINGPDSSKD